MRWWPQHWWHLRCDKGPVSSLISSQLTANDVCNYPDTRHRPADINPNTQWIILKWFTKLGLISFSLTLTDHRWQDVTNLCVNESVTPEIELLWLSQRKLTLYTGTLQRVKCFITGYYAVWHHGTSVSQHHILVSASWHYLNITTGLKYFKIWFLITLPVMTLGI